MSMTTLTACAGTIDIDDSMEKEEYKGGDGPGFMSVYKDEIIINGEVGATQWGTVDASTSIDGVNVGQNIPRQVAKMMARTVLGSAPANDDFDGEGADAWGNFSFSPGTILSTTNTETMAALSGNGAMNAVYNALKKVAMGVLFVVWFMGFVSSAASEQISTETALKSLLQLVCGMLIVLNADIFAKAFAQLGNIAIGDPSIGALGASYGKLTSQVTKLMKSINYLGIGVNIGVITKGFLCLWWDSGSLFVIALLAYPFYQALRAAYKIVSIMISRYFELIFGVAVAPIALALSSQRGFDHGVIMYLRKIAAAALQPFLIVVAVMSFDSLTTMVLAIFGGGNPGGFGVIPAVVAISASYMVFSAFVGETKHIAKEFIAH